MNADEQATPEETAKSGVLTVRMPFDLPLKETQFSALTLLNNELMSLTTIAQLLMLEQVYFLPNSLNQFAQLV